MATAIKQVRERMCKFALVSNIDWSFFIEHETTKKIYSWKNIFENEYNIRIKIVN